MYWDVKKKIKTYIFGEVWGNKSLNIIVRIQKNLVTTKKTMKSSEKCFQL